MFRGALVSFLFAAALVAAPASNPAAAIEWVKQINGSGVNQVTGTAVDAQGDFYITGSTSSPDFPATKTVGKASGTSVFVIELDPNGQVVYAIRVGGSGVDTPAGIAVASDGGVYAGGTTTSTDFPVTKGAYQTTAAPPGGNTIGSFLLRLNPGGSLGWATYFGDWNTSATVVAVGPEGNPYIAGFSYGNLPTTLGAYRTQFQTVENCTGVTGCFTPPPSGFISKFAADGSTLSYSTYTLSGTGFDLAYSVTQWGGALAIDPLGNAYFTSGDEETSISIGVMNANGSALLHSCPAPGDTVGALAFDPEGNVYVTGFADSNFQPTGGAFQTAPPPASEATGYFGNYGWSGAYVAKLDGGLSYTIAAALLGARGLVSGQGIAIDPAGNVVIGGYTTARNLPTQLPFQGSFVDEANFWGQDDITPSTGFVAKLDSTLSHLLFSTYAGDTRAFGVVGVAAAPNGDVLLAGETSVLYGQGSLPQFMPGGAIIANRVAFAPAPVVTLDSVVNFASKYAVPLSPGEAVQAFGSGFGADAQLLVDGSPITIASRSATSLVGLLPMDLKTSGALKIEVMSGGVTSNPVLMPAAVSSPGIYSIHGTGSGQGYIRNSDGSFNSPNRPAKPGDAITIFATGVGNLSIEDGFVVTPLPISIFVDQFYANGVSSAYSGAGGLPGKTYQITVTIPTAADIAKNIPQLAGFKYPSEVAVTMVLGPIHTQNSLYPENSAAVSQPGIALYIEN